MPLATRIFMLKPEHKKQRKKQEARRRKVSCECTRTIFLFSLISLLLFGIGLAMCFIAYHASSAIMGLEKTDMKPQDANRQLSEGDSRLYKLLYNFRIIGPIFMGTGGFIMLCCIVVAYRDEKEKKEEPDFLSNSDKGVSYDVYDLAIRKYLQIDDERTRKRNSHKANTPSKGTPKGSPGNGKEERSSSIKSLEQAILKLGGLVPQGMFAPPSRRSSDASHPTNAAAQEDETSETMARRPEETKPHQVVDMSNYTKKKKLSSTSKRQQLKRDPSESSECSLPIGLREDSAGSLERTSRPQSSSRAQQEDTPTAFTRRISVRQTVPLVVVNDDSATQVVSISREGSLVTSQPHSNVGESVIPNGSVQSPFLADKNIPLADVSE